ncbi:arsenite methyltransferase [Cesiribacter andamanensis]|nr:arsenite methyltransferase [Cesiribacter andamanensis]
MTSIKKTIQEAYTGVVLHQQSCCSTTAPSIASSCCGTAAEGTDFSEAYLDQPGYLPEADYGLGCGIPVAFAGIEPGQTVLDLGAGAGNDVFVARSLVGEKGKIIGLDMTPAMVNKANANKQKLGYANVEFILGEIEHLPLADETVDTVISNCVLNLVPDKAAAFGEIWRVLNRGGHFCISDVVLSGPLPAKLKGVAELYAACISGAIEKEAYVQTIRQAGFQELVIHTEKQLPLSDDLLLQHLTEEELEEYRASGHQLLSITVSGYKAV